MLSVSSHSSEQTTSQPGFGAFLRGRRHGLAGILFLVVLMAAMIGIELRVSYLNARESASTSAQGLSLLLKEQFDAALKETNLLLREVVDQLVIMGAVSPSRPMIEARKQTLRTFLADKRATLPQVSGLVVLSAKGDMVAEEELRVNPDLMQDLQRKLQDNPGQQSVVSPPFQPPASSSFNILVGYRIASPDGAYLGMVVAVLDLEFFGQLAYRQQSLPGGVFVLMNNESVVLAAQPEDEFAIGRALPDAASFAEWFNGRSKGYRGGVKAIDGESRSYSFQRLEQYPLLVMVGLSDWAQLQHWRFRAGAYVAAGTLLAALIVLMRYRSWHQGMTLQAETDKVKHQTEQDRQLRKLVESLALPLLVVRAQDEEILIANRAVSKLLGTAPERLLATKLHTYYFRPEHRAEIAQRLSDGHAVADYEIKLCRKEAPPFWGALSIAEMAYQGGEAWLVSLHDISERKAASDALWRRATRDPLTGIANRGYLMERAQIEWLRAKRYQTALSVLLFDLDFFKQINDVYGHATGDTALEQFARLVREELRESDLFGRLGGEEFAAILPGQDIVAAQSVAERIRLRQERDQVTLEDGLTIPLTVSIGISTLEAGVLGVDMLIRRADLALYAAKHAGRNRAQTWFAELESQTGRVT